MFAAAGISTISRFSANSSNHSGRPSVLFPASTRQFLGASLPCEFAGFYEVTESCGGDVEEELVLELDSPGTTKGM